MSLLAPWFLLGGLALALPVVFHLVRRTTRDRRPFSSLMFLQPVPPRLNRRSRIDDWLLLLLRCLALALLALGFARPLWQGELPGLPTAGGRERVAILVDTSASLQRPGLWEQSLARVEKHLREAGPQDDVSVSVFDRQVRPVLTSEDWAALPVSERVNEARRRLEAVTVGWQATRLGAAVIETAEALSEADAGTFAVRRLVVVTDGQEGSRLDALPSFEWPKGIEVALEWVRPPTPGNASLQLVAESVGAGAMDVAPVRVRVGNAPDSTREQFEVGWAAGEGGGFVGTAVAVYVPPGQSRVVTLPDAPAGAERVHLRGDDVVFDNDVFVVPPETRRLEILYLGSDDAIDSRQPLYFLERAVPTTRRQAVTVRAQVPGTGGVPDLASADLIVVTETLPVSWTTAVRQRAEAGATVLIMPKDAPATEMWSALTQESWGRIVLAGEGSYAMWSRVDLDHPLFAPFADPRFSDFTKIRFWRHWEMDGAPPAAARVIAQFDSGSPAMIEWPVGQGRMLWLGSGWHPTDSQLGLSTKFVPLVFSLLALGGNAEPAPVQYYVGDPVALGGGERPTGVVLPDGSRIELTAEDASFAGARMPGVYRLEGNAAGRRVAVNLDPAESRTAPLAAGELERLGTPTSGSASGAVGGAGPAPVAEGRIAAESRQKLWRWLLLGTLGVLLVESALAGWTSRRSTITEAVPT